MDGESQRDLGVGGIPACKPPHDFRAGRFRYDIIASAVQPRKGDDRHEMRQCDNSLADFSLSINGRLGRLMYTETKAGGHTGGGDMPPERKERAGRIIELFEDRLQKIVVSAGVPQRHMRPLAPGTVVCGAFQDIIFVGYLPQLGMPTLSFISLTATGQPSILGFHSFLLDKTTHDFSVVELRESWLDLDEPTRSATLDAVALQVVQNELARVKVPTTMIPFNPTFGPNKYPVQEKLVFVLMPFEPGLTEIYTTVVKPAVEAKGLICRRADDINSNNAIMSDIWKSICEARFIIADLSTRNPNVMYELGVSHTVGKETILIHQDTDGSKFPFDISHFRIINYQNSVTGGLSLKGKLEATIDSVLQKLSTARLVG
jgi:hypothetical protein